jgi:hypothetical protein
MVDPSLPGVTRSWPAVWADASLRATRRHFFGRSACGLGAAALGALLQRSLSATELSATELSAADGEMPHGALEAYHHRPRARRVIYLFMSGAPSQLDLFDYKPRARELFDQELPDSVRRGQRLTTMTSGQSRLPILPSAYAFRQHGQSGAWMSDLLPHMATMVDDLAIVKSVHTEAINHDPAITYMQTGSQIPGRPSVGAWVSYGIGSLNDNLPSFVVMHSRWSAQREAQAVFERLYGAGFLASSHAGVAWRSAGDPVLYLSNPPGVDARVRRRMLDAVGDLNRWQLEQTGDPEIEARIAQYELAFRMQTSVPGLTDWSDEPASVVESYGPEVRQPGSFAYNCLMARRLAERNVRFIQVFHRGWDQHSDLSRDLPLQCRDVDQPTAALLRDLKNKGLLDDTLVVWGGEFGRTIYCQGDPRQASHGRDHHPRCFTVLLAGGGVKPGISHGRTDDLGYNIEEGGVHLHDLNATLLHCLGVDHERLTYRFQGRDYRLTDVHGRVVTDLLS